MPSVQAKKNEPFERMFKRWKRLVENDGLLNELRQREFYEKPSQKRKRAAAAAKKRWERKQSEMNVAGSRKRLY